MKLQKLFFLLTVTFLSFTNLKAAEVKGVIITEKENLNVIFIIPSYALPTDINYIRLQYKIKHWDSKRKKKKTLRPEDAKEIRFTYKDEEIRMISHYNSLGGFALVTTDYIFLKLKQEGDLRLFKFYYSDNSMVSSRYILHKKGGKLISVRLFFF